VRDDPDVVALVARASGPDESAAWKEIVDRYASLVWSICLRYRLSPADIEDVHQTVWCGLYEQLGQLRDPAALPGWLSTTTRRECLRLLKLSGRYEPFGGEPEDGVLAAEADPGEVEEEVLRAERHALLRQALAELPDSYRRLLTLLASDPPLSYPEISDILGIPPGSIGPMRGRGLELLRRSPRLAGLSDLMPPRTTTAPPPHPAPVQNAAPAPRPAPTALAPPYAAPARRTSTRRSTVSSGGTGQATARDARRRRDR
jgi:RNA polymerase sigma factor (sigma-70 family)